MNRVIAEEELQHRDDECSIAIPRLNHYTVKTVADEDGLAEDEYETSDDETRTQKMVCRRTTRTMWRERKVVDDDVKTPGGVDKHGRATMMTEGFQSEPLGYRVRW